MSEALQIVQARWPWATPFVLVLLAVQRWRHLRRQAPPRPTAPSDGWEHPEESLFPSRPGSGFARLLSSPMRAALKEAGEQALQEEVAGLRADLRRTQADNSRLRAELDSRGGSSTLFTDTAMDRSLRPRRRRRRLPTSANSAPPSGAADGSRSTRPSSPRTTKEATDE